MGVKLKNMPASRRVGGGAPFSLADLCILCLFCILFVFLFLSKHLYNNPRARMHVSDVPADARKFRGENMVKKKAKGKKKK